MKYSIEELISTYGEGKNYPTRNQWQMLVDGNLDTPLTVVNLFKLRDVADVNLINEDISGEQAFAKYAQTSVPKVDKVGGHFILRGVVEGNFIGDNIENWHIVAIGHYPKKENFLQLLLDEDYKKVFKYRQAAVESQTVFFINTM
jgi:uncharacterized protein (DUF1330 family)